MGPGVMDPGKSIGAVTQRRYMALAFILAKSSFFLSLGLNPLNLKFSIRRGEAWCIGSIVPRRSREHGVHRITIKTHASNHILSNVFDDSPGNLWTHREDPIKIKRARSTESVGPHGTIVRSWPTIHARS